MRQRAKPAIESNRTSDWTKCYMQTLSESNEEKKKRTPTNEPTALRISVFEKSQMYAAINVCILKESIATPTEYIVSAANQ